MKSKTGVWLGLVVIITLFLAILASVENVSALTTCYQEFANVSTACGGKDTGSYFIDDNWLINPPTTTASHIFDGDWNTFAHNEAPWAFNAYMRVNYTKPDNAAGAILQVKMSQNRTDNFFTANYTIPITCWNYYPNQVSIILRSGYEEGDIGCINSAVGHTSYELMHRQGPNSGWIYFFFYEEAINWIMDQLFIQLDDPSGDIVIPEILYFNASINSNVSSSISNATFFLWKDGSLNRTIDYTGLSGTNLSLSYSLNGSSLSSDDYDWNIYSCGGGGDYCTWAAENNSISLFSFIFNETTNYNVSTYEMRKESFTTTGITSGTINNVSLNFDGVNYPATITSLGDNDTYSFNVIIDIEIGPGNKSFYWIVTEQYTQNSTMNYVNVLESSFIKCNETNNVTYINFSYKDEISLSRINASIDQAVFNYSIVGSPFSKTYTFSNTTEWPEHSFCFTPSSDNILINRATYRFSSAGYSTKIWPIRNLVLTSASNNYLLYMINLLDSGTTPVTFSIINSVTSSAIEDARVAIYRDLNGVSTLINDGYTDAAGSISYFMSPIYSYQIVVTSTGCSTLSTSITPTSSTYSLIVNCGSVFDPDLYKSEISGILYKRGPPVGVLFPGNVIFDFHLNSSINNMTRVRFELYNENNLLAFNDSITLSGTTCNSKECYLTISLLVAPGDDIKGRYYVSINDTLELLLLEADARWRTIMINNTASSARRFFNNFQELIQNWGSYECNKYKTQSTCAADSNCRWLNSSLYVEVFLDVNSFNPVIHGAEYLARNQCVMADEYNKREFDRFVIVFFFMAVGLFMFSKLTNYDLGNTGIFVIIFSIIVFILSYYKIFYLSGMTNFNLFNQYGIFIFTLLIAIGLGFNIARSAQR